MIPISVPGDKSRSGLADKHPQDGLAGRACNSADVSGADVWINTAGAGLAGNEISPVSRA
jgi:hypothetical protein